MADVLTRMAEQIGAPLEVVFRNAAADLQSLTERLTALLLAAWQTGQVNDAEFRDSLHSLLVTGYDNGLMVGDVLGSAYIDAEPVGLRIDDDTTERLALSAATATKYLDQASDPLPRLTRLTTGEHLWSLQLGTQTAYREHGVPGYRRGLSAKACELCVWLYKDGYVYPTDKPMHKHPGCTCVPVPVTN